ncbi:hypothetical protein FKP32DRAFT_796620 [Trametes sanguinea]|nr:hypothetical protein FKP32DRAFT_796620 [Trametes sanguinea]
MSTSTAEVDLTGHHPEILPISIAFQDGVVLETEYDYVKHKHKITCDLCNTTIYLNRTGHRRFIDDHRQSNACDIARGKLERRRHREEMAAVRQSINEMQSSMSPGLRFANSSGPTSFHLYRQPPASQFATPTTTPSHSVPTSSRNSPRVFSAPLCNLISAKVRGGSNRCPES